MISVEQARAALEAATAALDLVEVPLDAAHGKVLGETVRADRDFPPTDRSAMDGFAVRSADVGSAGVELAIVGELRAGQPVGDLRVGPGQAARIMTGAIVPPGSDAVVMVERTTETEPGRRVRIESPCETGQHVRRRGEDLLAGAPALESGVAIDSPEIAALTSVGCSRVRVHRSPRVNVLSTGDEIVEPDRTPGDHQVRNSNAYALIAQLAELGLEGRYLGIAGDERDRLQALLTRGLAGDVLLVTGGVSVGKYDLVADVLAEAGMRLLFHKIAMKPGKPVLAGKRGDCLVLGLPGNPVSTYTVFAVLVAPALRRMMGHRRWDDRPLRATMAGPLRARPGRTTYHLARIETGRDGLTAERIDTAGSGDVLALARANGFIVTPVEGASHAPGAVVPVLPWPRFNLR